LHAFAEGGAEVGEAGEIVGERFCDFDEFLGGVGDEFGQIEVGELTEAGAGDGGLPPPTGERYHGDAHPAGVEGGGVSVVGEGVEAKVDAVVEFEILLARLAVEEGDAGGIDGKLVEYAGAGGAFGGEDEHAGGGEGVEDLGPEVEGGLCDFAEVVEAGEGDVVVGEGGEGVD